MYYEEVDNQFMVGKSTKTFEVSPKVIDELHEKKKIDTENLSLYPNQGTILKCQSQSVIGITSSCGNFIKKSYDITHFGVSSRNNPKQMILQNVLDDPDVRCVIVTGPAGTGKSFMCAAYALDSVLGNQEHDKLVMSKPMEIVTSTRYWGTTPGPEEDKFAPFVKSFEIIFNNIASDSMQYAIDGNKIEFMPLELMRGATFRSSVVWFDEAQNLNLHEMETLGSRIDDRGNSKLLVTGDLNQKDKKLRKKDSGIRQMLESNHFLNSPRCAHIHLTQNERGEISQLFYDIFHN